MRAQIIGATVQKMQKASHWTGANNEAMVNAAINAEGPGDWFPFLMASLVSKDTFVVSTLANCFYELYAHGELEFLEKGVRAPALVASALTRLEKQTVKGTAIDLVRLCTAMIVGTTSDNYVTGAGIKSAFTVLMKCAAYADGNTARINIIQCIELLHRRYTGDPETAAYLVKGAVRRAVFGAVINKPVIFAERLALGSEEYLESLTQEEQAMLLLIQCILDFGRYDTSPTIVSVALSLLQFVLHFDFYSFDVLALIQSNVIPFLFQAMKTPSIQVYAVAVGTYLELCTKYHLEVADLQAQELPVVFREVIAKGMSEFPTEYMMRLFVYYDCELGRKNICESIIKLISTYSLALEGIFNSLHLYSKAFHRNDLIAKKLSKEHTLDVIDEINSTGKISPEVENPAEFFVANISMLNTNTLAFTLLANPLLFNDFVDLIGLRGESLVKDFYSLLAYISIPSRPTVLDGIISLFANYYQTTFSISIDVYKYCIAIIDAYGNGTPSLLSSSDLAFIRANKIPPPPKRAPVYLEATSTTQIVDIAGLIYSRFGLGLHTVVTKTPGLVIPLISITAENGMEEECNFWISTLCSFHDPNLLRRFLTLRVGEFSSEVWKKLLSWYPYANELYQVQSDAFSRALCELASAEIAQRKTFFLDRILEKEHVDQVTRDFLVEHCLHVESWVSEYILNKLEDPGLTVHCHEVFRILYGVIRDNPAIGRVKQLVVEHYDCLKDSGSLLLQILQYLPSHLYLVVPDFGSLIEQGLTEQLVSLIQINTDLHGKFIQYIVEHHCDPSVLEVAINGFHGLSLEQLSDYDLRMYLGVLMPVLPAIVSKYPEDCLQIAMESLNVPGLCILAERFPSEICSFLIGPNELPAAAHLPIALKLCPKLDKEQLTALKRSDVSIAAQFICASYLNSEDIAHLGKQLFDSKEHILLVLDSCGMLNDKAFASLAKEIASDVSELIATDDADYSLPVSKFFVRLSN